MVPRSKEALKMHVWGGASIKARFLCSLEGILSGPATE